MHTCKISAVGVTVAHLRKDSTVMLVRHDVVCVVGTWLDRTFAVLSESAFPAAIYEAHGNHLKEAVGAGHPQVGM